MEALVTFLFTFLLSYLVGSIPFGLIIGRLYGLGDIRNSGSGNIGATNVLRMGSKKMAALTLLLDFIKGALPVFIASNFGLTFAAIASVAAVVGHCYPAWLQFKGGKGVATSLGCLLSLSPIVFLLCAMTWLTILLIFRVSSLSALIAFIIAPLAMAILGPPLYIIPSFLLAGLIWLRHRDNIKRLINKEEPTIEFKNNEH